MSTHQAAELLYDLVARQTDAAAVYRGEYGAGAFYLAFASPTEASAFVAAPSMAQNGLMYLDEQRCRTLGLPDVTLGALVAGRAPAIVVVDQFEPGMRCCSDSDGTVHDVHGVQLTRHAVETGPSEATVAAVEARVRQARQDADPAASDGDAAIIYYVDDDGDAAATAAATVERVSISEINSAIAAYTQDGGTVPQSMQLLRQLASTCPADSVVVWLKAPGLPDTAWQLRVTGPLE